MFRLELHQSAEFSRGIIFQLALVLGFIFFDFSGFLFSLFLPGSFGFGRKIPGWERFCDQTWGKVVEADKWGIRLAKAGVRRDIVELKLTRCRSYLSYVCEASWIYGGSAK